MLAKAMKKFLAELEKQSRQSASKSSHGKLSMRELTEQGANLQNIEITDKNIKSFERVARKYQVDFTPKKDISTSPPKWLVFFKAKDIDSITAAFNEYSAKMLRRTRKPSVIAQIKHFKEIVKNAVLAPMKNMKRGGHEL